MKCYRCEADIGDRLGLCERCAAGLDPTHPFDPDLMTIKIGEIDLTCAPASSRIAALFIDLTILKVAEVALDLLWLRFTHNSLRAKAEVWMGNLLPQLSLPGWEDIPNRTLYSFAFTEYLSMMAVLLSIGWIYFAASESGRLQATLGKRMLGLRVTSLSGERLSFSQATVRHLARFAALIVIVPGFVYLLSPSAHENWEFTFLALMLIGPAGLGLTLLSIIFETLTDSRQGLHDLLSGSVVLVSFENQVARSYGTLTIATLFFAGVISAYGYIAYPRPGDEPILENLRKKYKTTIQMPRFIPYGNRTTR